MIKASYTFLLFNFPFECFIRPSLYYKFPHQKIISHFHSESPTRLPAPGSFRPSCPPPRLDLKGWLTGRKSELADMSSQQSEFSDPMSKVFKGKSKANLCLTELGDSLSVIFCAVLSGISETVPLFLIITSSHFLDVDHSHYLDKLQEWELLKVSILFTHKVLFSFRTLALTDARD